MTGSSDDRSEECSLLPVHFIVTLTLKVACELAQLY